MTSFDIAVFVICALCLSYGVIIYGVIMALEKREIVVLFAGLLSFFVIMAVGCKAYHDAVSVESAEIVEIAEGEYQDEIIEGD